MQSLLRGVMFVGKKYSEIYKIIMICLIGLMTTSNSNELPG